jgi:hypothetical protein
MQTMSRSQRENLGRVLEDMEDLIDKVKTGRFDFGLSWRDEEKLWDVKLRVEEILTRIENL